MTPARAWTNSSARPIASAPARGRHRRSSAGRPSSTAPKLRSRPLPRVSRAVVYGTPQPASGVWRDHLAWDERAMIQKDTHPRDPRAAEAVSRYRVVETFRDASLLEVALVTGKRNQIRLQARLRGHTLIGE